MITKEEIKSKILELLGRQVKFADAKLADGTMVQAEAFEVGKELRVVAEDGGTSVAPDGEHTLEDGSVIVVANGLISEIKAPEVEPAQTEIEVEMAALKTKCAELEAKIAEMSTKMSKVEAEKTEAETKLSKVEEYVKKLEDAPAAKPTKKETTFKKEVAQSEQVNFSAMTVEERAMYYITKNQN